MSSLFFGNNSGIQAIIWLASALKASAVLAKRFATWQNAGTDTYNINKDLKVQISAEFVRIGESKRDEIKILRSCIIELEQLLAARDVDLFKLATELENARITFPIK